MVDFKRGIYTKTFSYTDVDNVNQELILRPLKGKHFPMLLELMKKMGKMQGQDNFLEALDKETSESLYSMCFETLKNSYPTANEEELEMFTSSHLMELFPVIIELNLNAKGIKA